MSYTHTEKAHTIELLETMLASIRSGEKEIVEYKSYYETAKYACDEHECLNTIFGSQHIEFVIEQRTYPHLRP